VQPERRKLPKVESEKALLKAGPKRPAFFALLNFELKKR
jgi:hypothetical protein